MELLSGWKEIADHLHLTVRTAQRWERLGLPVRRVSDSTCSPVVAISDELELWARTRDVKTDTALLASNKFLVSQLTDLRETHFRARRETMELLGQIGDLADEQKRLLYRIQANLTPRTIDSENDKVKSDPSTRTGLDQHPRSPITIFPSVRPPSSPPGL